MLTRSAVRLQIDRPDPCGEQLLDREGPRWGQPDVATAAFVVASGVGAG